MTMGLQNKKFDYAHKISLTQNYDLMSSHCPSLSMLLPVLNIGFMLFYDTGLSKDIRCHVWPYFF